MQNAARSVCEMCSVLADFTGFRARTEEVPEQPLLSRTPQSRQHMQRWDGPAWADVLLAGGPGYEHPTPWASTAQGWAGLRAAASALEQEVLGQARAGERPPQCGNHPGKARQGSLQLLSPSSMGTLHCWAQPGCACACPVLEPCAGVQLELWELILLDAFPNERWNNS